MTPALSYCDYRDSSSPSCGRRGWGFPGERQPPESSDGCLKCLTLCQVEMIEPCLCEASASDPRSWGEKREAYLCLCIEDISTICPFCSEVVSCLTVMVTQHRGDDPQGALRSVSKPLGG